MALAHLVACGDGYSPPGNFVPRRDASTDGGGGAGGGGNSDADLTDSGPESAPGSDATLDAPTRGPGGAWAHRFGTSEKSNGYAVKIDRAGDVVVAGFLSGSMSLGGGRVLASTAGNNDIFVLKYSSSGTYLWSKQLGGAGTDFAWSLAVDGSDNIFVAGCFELSADFGGGTKTAAGSDMVIVKYAPGGGHLWSKSFGGTGGDCLWGVDADPSGDVLIIGDTFQTVDFGGGPLTSTTTTDIVIAKLSGVDGAYRWAKRLPGTGDENPYGIDTDAAGNALVIGDFAASLDAGGPSPLMTSGKKDVFVGKYAAADGATLWAKGWGGSEDDIGYAIATEPSVSGDVYIGGAFNGSASFGSAPLVATFGSDIVVAKYTGLSGGHVWSKSFGGTGAARVPFEEAQGMATDAAGNVIVTGYFGATISFGGSPLEGGANDDVFVTKLTPAGGHMWSRSYGAATGVCRGYAVAMDPAGNAAVTGLLRGDVDFGGGTLPTTKEDAFLLHLRP